MFKTVKSKGKKKLSFYRSSNTFLIQKYRVKEAEVSPLLSSLLLLRSDNIKIWANQLTRTSGKSRFTYLFALIDAFKSALIGVFIGIFIGVFIGLFIAALKSAVIGALIDAFIESLMGAFKLPS